MNVIKHVNVVKKLAFGLMSLVAGVALAGEPLSSSVWTKVATGLTLEEVSGITATIGGNSINTPATVNGVFPHVTNILNGDGVIEEVFNVQFGTFEGSFYRLFVHDCGYSFAA